VSASPCSTSSCSSREENVAKWPPAAWQACSAALALRCCAYSVNLLPVLLAVMATEAVGRSSLHWENQQSSAVLMGRVSGRC
jgi:hypothetical protein